MFVNVFIVFCIEKKIRKRAVQASISPFFLDFGLTFLQKKKLITTEKVTTVFPEVFNSPFFKISNRNFLMSQKKCFAPKKKSQKWPKPGSTSKHKRGTHKSLGVTPLGAAASPTNPPPGPKSTKCLAFDTRGNLECRDLPGTTGMVKKFIENYPESLREVLAHHPQPTGCTGCPVSPEHGRHARAGGQHPNHLMLCPVKGVAGGDRAPAGQRGMRSLLREARFLDIVLGEGGGDRSFQFCPHPLKIIQCF